MTEDMTRAEAAKAEAAANAIFAKIEAGRGGSDALRPAGFDREFERASDLKRRARSLTAEADAMRAEAAAPTTHPAPAAPKAPATNSASAAAHGAAPLAPEAAVVEDPVAVIAARILNSDSAVPGEAPAPHMGSGTAETADAIVERILRA